MGSNSVEASKERVDFRFAHVALLTRKSDVIFVDFDFSEGLIRNSISGQF